MLGVCDRHLTVQKTRPGDRIESWEMILENGVSVTVKVKKPQISQRGLASGNVSVYLICFPSNSPGEIPSASGYNCIPNRVVHHRVKLRVLPHFWSKVAKNPRNTGQKTCFGKFHLPSIYH